MNIASNIASTESIASWADANSSEQRMTEPVSALDNVTEKIHRLRIDAPIASNVPVSWADATPQTASKKMRITPRSKKSYMAALAVQYNNGKFEKCCVVADDFWLTSECDSEDWLDQILDVLYTENVQELVVMGRRVLNMIPRESVPYIKLAIDNYLKYECRQCGTKVCCVKKAYYCWRREMSHKTCQLDCVT